jgi:hypothetical protein
VACASGRPRGTNTEPGPLVLARIRIRAAGNDGRRRPNARATAGVTRRPASRRQATRAAAPASRKLQARAGGDDGPDPARRPATRPSSTRYEHRRTRPALADVTYRDRPLPTSRSHPASIPRPSDRLTADPCLTSSLCFCSTFSCLPPPRLRPHLHAWAALPDLSGRSRKGGPARSGGPPFLQSPGLMRDLGRRRGGGLFVS